MRLSLFIFGLTCIFVSGLLIGKNLGRIWPLLLVCAWPLVTFGQIPFSLQDRAFLQSTSPLRKDLVGYWRLEESSGTRYDFSKNGNHLTSNNSVGQAAGVSAYTGNAARFVSASSQYLTAQSSNVLQISINQPLTITAWVKLTNTGTSQVIVGKFNSAANRGWNFYTSINGGLGFEVTSSGTSSRYRVGSTSVTNQVWRFVCATYDGSATTNGISLFVDNAVQTYVSAFQGGVATGIDSTAVFGISTYNSGSALYCNGLVDEVSIHTNVLSAAKLTQLYNAGLGTHFPWAHP